MNRACSIFTIVFTAILIYGCDSHPRLSATERKQILERLELGTTYEAVVKELGDPTGQTEKKIVTMLKIFPDNSSLATKFVDGILTGRYTGVADNIKGFGSDNKMISVTDYITEYY